jgi:nucleotide-binding universal stress UspA family protein
MRKLSKILVATDFSESAQAALEQAAELARAFHASLEVLHVWEIPVFLPGELVVGMAGEQESLMDLVQKRANHRLVELAAKAEAGGIHISSLSCVLGIPHATIVDTATAGKHDIVVLGSHGRTGLKRALLGSVAERVVRHAPCTVVIARQPKLAPGD